MKYLSNSRKLYYLAASISLMMLIMFGLLYLEKSRDQVQYIDAVEHTYKVLSAISFCEKSLVEAEAAQRGYLLTQENIFKERFEIILPSIDSALKKIGWLTSDNSGQKVFFFQLSKYVTARTEIMRQNLTMRPDSSFFFENLRKGAFIMDNCRLYMKKMREVEEGLLRVRVEKKKNNQQVNIGFFTATFISSCLICLIAIVIFFRELRIRLSAQQNLKAKITELSKSKNELEEITFAASHDLQEPMRKVRILSSMMIKKLAHKVPEAELEVLHRIEKVTEQMHGLLNDLVIYTTLLDPDEKFSEVKLYDICRGAYNKVYGNDTIQFHISASLPVIKGSSAQLEIMFVHLFDNALKFKSPGRDLAVEIKYEFSHFRGRKPFWRQVPTEKHHKITITDNGIGFDKQYADKIFGLFQRLHSQSEYPGKGIGLAVARRVMANHQGSIYSLSEKNGGASFILLFPLDD